MAPTTLFGAVFANAVSSASTLTIHYDEAILSSSSCPSPMTCATCNDCNGQACIGGTCTGCTTSSDCCPPLVCGPQGRCVAALIP
jgi:hypothetical protein